MEQANAAHVLRRVEFDLNIQEKFGPETTPDQESMITSMMLTVGMTNGWRAGVRSLETGDWLADELAGNPDDEIPTWRRRRFANAGSR